MQHTVFIVESQPALAKVLKKQVLQAGLYPVVAYTLDAAKNAFLESVPETILCAIVGMHHCDAEPCEAISYTTSVAIPTIAVSSYMDKDWRKLALRHDVVDYVGLENAQTIAYLYRLVMRLNKNKSLGTLVYSKSHRVLNETKQLLQRHGFQTYQSDALSTVREILLERPHIKLVMLDIDDNPSEMSTFVADLRKFAHQDELIIVGMAKRSSDFHAAHLIKCGATDVFTLPFDHEAFLCRVTQMLEAIEHVALIRQTANQDYLTGLPNRRHFFYSVNKLLPVEIATQALALIDLDHFKRINDNKGHDAGDAVLKHVAQILARQFEHAIIARFGGEEFCVYIANVNAKDAIAQMETLRHTIAETPVDFNCESLRVTASIGLIIAEHSNVEAMLSKADALLYEAKDSGRNKVVSDVSLVN